MDTTKESDEARYARAMAEITNLRRISLEDLKKIPKRSVNCRRAYIAGAYMALTMISAYAELGFPEISNAYFWPYFLLESYQNEGRKLNTIEYVAKIQDMSRGVLALTPKDIIESGFRYGVTGEYYSRGTIAVCFVFVSDYIHKSGSRYKETVEWVNSMYVWYASLLS